MKKRIIKFCYFIVVFLFLIYTGLYFFQEKLIFFPDKLPANHQYSFSYPFKELSIKTKDNKKLSALLFTTNKPKGIILYLHGNSGDLQSWGKLAPIYTQLGYDILFFDYRGFGKSEGKITNNEQLFQDNQAVFNQVKKLYSNHKIIILGYSIGSGMAAELASRNKVNHLILNAPYYQLSDIIEQRFPMIPTFLLRYPIKTYQYLDKVTQPVTIFHGTDDGIIYFESAQKLKNRRPKNTTLIPLIGHGHADIEQNTLYNTKIAQLLAQ